MRSFVMTILVCAYLLAGPVLARAERWEIEPAAGRSEVTFHSKATMDSFDGSTRDIEGWIELDPATPATDPAWEVRVDLASLDTGIGLRNQHMRENHLHTDDYPYAVFRGGAIEPVPPEGLARGARTRLDLTGEFELHGVTRPRTIPVELVWLEDGTLEATAEFTVSLEDHAISRPKFLLLKLADVQRVELHLVATPAREGS